MKDQRRELRLSSRDDDLITEAAGLLGVSVSEFLLDRAVQDAEAIVDEHHTVRVCREDYDRFMEVLDRPAAPIKTLVDQIRQARPIKRAY